MKPFNLKTIARGISAMLVSALAVSSARADYPSTVLSYSPLAYYRFTEAASSQPLNSVTNYGTFGGNLNHGNGYLIGAVTKGAPGIIGNCAYFSEPLATSDVGAADAKIEVPWSAALNPAPPLSIEFWMKPNTLSDDANGYCPISSMDVNDYGNGNRSGWLFYCNSSGAWQFRLGATSGYAGIVKNTSGGNASVGVWEHIVGTWDGTNANLYANGVLVGTTPTPLASWTANSEAPIRMGASPLLGDDAFSPYDCDYANSGNRGYDGYLEQVAIYTNVLSATTIAAHYSAATTNTAGYTNQILASHPVGYWPLNEPAYTPSTNYVVMAANSGILGSDANATNEFGTLNGQPGPGYAGFGTDSNAVFFDGANGYCLINDTTNLHFANAALTPNYISLAAWIKPTEKDFYRHIISHGYDSQDNQVFLRITSNDQNLANYDGDGNGIFYSVGMSDAINGEDEISFPVPPGDIGNWVFLVGTYDGTYWNLYRDGVLVGQEVAQLAGPIDVVGPWSIGSITPEPGNDFNNPPQVVGQGEFFGGWIAEPAIFTNALQPSDVAALYAAAKVPPVITLGLVNPGTVSAGSSVAFTAQADGVPNLGYQWYVNGASASDTTTNYTFVAGTAGTYTVAVVVTNAYGAATNAVTFPVVNAAPAITTQPDPSEERYVGYPFGFSVAATGTTPFTYYWKLGSTVVQSGSSSTYSNTASLANAGTYTVIVSNIVGTATSSAAVLTVNTNPGNYTSNVLANGPIAYWRLDETSGTIAHDQIGGNDGTYFNAVLGIVPGYVATSIDPDSKAVEFNGTNSYVGNISGTAINFAGTNNNSFTLEAWVNAAAGQQNEATIIAKGIGLNGTTENEQFSLDVDTSAVDTQGSQGVYRFFTTETARGTATKYSADATDGPNGTWQHVVGVYSSSSQNLTIYVNGQPEGSVAYTGPINNTTSPVTIGSKRTGNDPNYDGTFDGLIDNVAVYNYALTANQVLADYNSAYGTTLAPEILNQPLASTNFSGLPITLSVNAIGSAPLTYQWYENGTAISGATSSSYTISPALPSSAGSYYVKIANGVGTTNSATIPVVVLAPPTKPPVIPGLVMHLTFDTNLNDATGRGNNGVGQHLTIADISIAPTNEVRVPATPDTSGGGSNPSFYYTTDNAQPVAGSALHYSTLANTNGNGVGFGTNDWYVSLGVKPDLQFGSNDFTVSYWIRMPQGYDGGDLPFFTDSVNSTFGNGYVFAPAYGFGTVSPNPNPTPSNYGGWALSIFGSGVGIGYYGDEGSINDGNWHSLIHVINHAADSVTTYLDGAVAHQAKQSGSTTIDAAGNINVSTNASIGQDPTGAYGETASFDIDDLGVWKRALTPLEVGAIYSAAVSNSLSFTAPVTLTYYATNTTQLAISWPAGISPSSNFLQSATSPLGLFTNVVGATSPYVFTPTAAQKYYRIAQTNVYIIP